MRSYSCFKIKMDWLKEHYPKATKLDDYGMYGRDFPPEVVEYVHACWVRTGDVYEKPDTIEPVPETVITKEKYVIVKADIRNDIRPTPVVPVPLRSGMDETNKEALAVMAERGPDRAAEFMMSNAGGDYARMRSMYG